MEADQSLMLVALSELMDSDDKKATHSKSISWLKRSVSGYFINSIRKLMIDDRLAFKEMFRMSVRGLCWMKTPLVNQSNTKIMLDEAKKSWIKVCSDTNFHPTQFLSPNMIFPFFRRF